MDLLNLAVRIFADDQASATVDDVANHSIGNLVNAAKTAAKALASAFAVKKVVDFGKAAFDAYAEFEQLAGGTEKIFDELYQAAILNDANNAFLDLNMSANEYLESINTVGATFAQTMGDKKAYDTARTGMKAIADFASGTGADLGTLNEKYKLITRSAGSYQSIADQFAGILPQTTADFLEQAKAAGFLQEGYENLTDVPVAEYQEAVTKMLEKGVADAGFANNTMKESLGTLSGSMAAARSAWQNLVTEFGKPDADLGARIKDMVMVLMGDGSGNGLIANVTKEVGVIAKNIIAALSSGIGEGVDWLLTNGANMLRDGIKDMIAKLGDVSEFVRGMRSIDIGAALFGSGDSDSGILSRVGTMLSDMTENISEWMPDIQKAFGELWGSVSQVIAEKGPEILASIGTVLGGIGEWLITWWPEIQGWIIETWFGLLEWVYSNGPSILDAIGSIIDGIINWLIENGPAILEAAGQMIANIGTAIVEHAPEILYHIGEMVGQIIGWLIDHAIDFFNAAVEWVQQLMDGSSEKGAELRQWFADLPQNLANALGDLGHLLWDAGTAIIQGLWDGLKDKWSEVTDWVGGIGDWIAAHKGPKAYDLKLLVPNGQWIMQGLGEGLEKGLPSVQGILSDVTDSIQTGINTNVSIADAKPSGNSAILAALGEIRDNMSMSVMLDSGALVGGIAPQMNTALGGIY